MAFRINCVVSAAKEVANEYLEELKAIIKTQIQLVTFLNLI